MSRPVIVGAATVTQHSQDPEDSLDAVGLMTRASREAAARVPELLSRIGFVAVPRGTWRQPDAGRLVADGLGASDARTLDGRIGVLQTTVLATAFDAVADGTCEVALVVGGEALDRRRVARGLGKRAAETIQSPDVAPDVVLRPAEDFRSEHEIAWGIEEPFVQYALLDSARRHRLGVGIAEHRARLADLWAGFSAVAAGYDRAWDRTPWSATDLLDEQRRGNRMLAFPYTAKLVSGMYVDQASAILITNAGTAARLGVPCVHPVATVDCQMSVPVVERADPTSCPQWSVVGAAVERELGRPVRAVDHLDLYSCFPIAVDHQRDAFGLGDRTPLTVTGGMTFGGGPLNNAALHAVARTVDLLAEGGGTGVVTAVSGLLTKQGAVALSADEPREPHRHLDVTEQAAPLVARRGTVPVHTGPAVVEATTVVVPREGAPRAVALVRTPDGLGTVARSGEPELVRDFVEEDQVGRVVHVADGALGARVGRTA